MIPAGSVLFGCAVKEWQAVGIIHVPFDESGTSTESPYTVFAGVLADPPRWERFKAEWMNLLRAKNIAYFRAAEAFTFRGSWGQFGGNDPDKERQRDELVLALADCGCRHAIQVSWSAISADAFHALSEKRREQYKNQPFYVAFESNILSLLRSRFVASNDEFTLICDDSEAYSEESLKSFRRFVRTNPALSAHVAGICFLDDKRFPPLQLADLLAYCHRRNAIHAEPGIWRQVLDRFLALFTDTEPGDVRR